MTKILIFGVFDGIHKGHEDFLKQTRTYGDYIIAAVAQDENVEILKGKKPKKDLETRKRELRTTGLIDEAISGDIDLSSWNVIEKYKPDIVVLGYDQKVMGNALQEFLKERCSDIEIKITKPYKPEKHHSSIINN